MDFKEYSERVYNFFPKFKGQVLMDEEKERLLIEAAEVALDPPKRKTKTRTKTKTIPPSTKTELIKIHNSYLNWNEPLAKKLLEMPAMTFRAIEICEKFLRESRGNFFLISSRDFVEDQLRSLKGDLLARKLTGSYDEMFGVKRGRPINDRLYSYIFSMALWYHKFIGEPAYGTDSVFTRLVLSCLEIIDVEVSPHKQIKLALKDYRKRFPPGVKPWELYA